ncbi:hypothetical protein BX283_0445 [Streptomyces sp. TLI_146]|nr:hypothetical protein BX283_0445 [Streptomyces sp. TLI_146]
MRILPVQPPTAPLPTDTGGGEEWRCTAVARSQDALTDFLLRHGEGVALLAETDPPAMPCRWESCPNAADVPAHSPFPHRPTP